MTARNIANIINTVVHLLKLRRSFRVEESSITTALPPDMRAGLYTSITAAALRLLHNKTSAINHRETIVFAWNFIPRLGHGEGRFLPLDNTMFVEQQFTKAHEMGTTAQKKEEEEDIPTQLQGYSPVTLLNRDY
jgi:hypothetical protein